MILMYRVSKSNEKTILSYRCLYEFCMADQRDLTFYIPYISGQHDLVQTFCERSFIRI